MATPGGCVPYTPRSGRFLLTTDAVRGDSPDRGVIGHHTQEIVSLARVPILSAAPAGLLFAAVVGFVPGQDPGPRPKVPLVTGLVLGSVLHSPLGEREDVI